MTPELPKEIERKYLLEKPSNALLESLPEVSRTEIEQYYLQDDKSGYTRRVRKRGSPEAGWHYTYTRKRTVAFGERIELEEDIGEARFRELLTQAEPGQEISKSRYCFWYEGQKFELDVYAFSEDFATLEIELPSMDTPVKLPPFLPVLREVTGDAAYTNASLARTHRFP